MPQIQGKVRDLDTGQPVSGVLVEAWDRDLLFDDALGTTTSAVDGGFCFDDERFGDADFFDAHPEIYFVVKSREEVVLGTNKDDLRADRCDGGELELFIGHATLVEAGLAERRPADWLAAMDPQERARFTTLTLRQGIDAGRAEQFNEELAAHASVLEMLAGYRDALRGSVDNRAAPFDGLARLFAAGRTPEQVEGHFYGITLGIRSGDQSGITAEFGNVLGFLFGVAVADVCPWVGKSFSPLDPSKQGELTGGTLDDQVPGFAGINHFNRLDFRPLNLASFYLLTAWLDLAPTGRVEREIYGNEKNGGNFIAYKAPSVYAGTGREVFSLNYRHRSLGNPAPFKWLVDELVQIADGLYLGQLLFATAKLFSDYDPERSPSEDQYQHFGYFLLFDEGWNPEAHRLFPHLEMPVRAPGVVAKSPVAVTPGKYKTFTLEEGAPKGADPQVYAQLHAELSCQPTILHLLKSYGDELQDGLNNDAPQFRALKELFLRGIGIEQMEGRYRGALVTWHAEGLWRFFDLNTLNLAWMRVGRHFSTWTGKTFEPLGESRRQAITGGRETADQPLFWGANTQSLRTPNERFVGKLMGLADIWQEEVPAEEARAFGYDVKNFFFIAKQTPSVHPDLGGKTVFQFNYRWPKLRTIVPDCYCLDELVQIADGLYLGQLMYATALTLPYDPTTDPREYAYRSFGYFLLMDDNWHQLRLDIGFDLSNA